MRRLAGLSVWALALFLAVPVSAATSQLSGTASYRERIALPPGAVFDVILEDVSVAETPAVEMTRTTIADPGLPPFKFEITYDPDLINPEGAYSVRAEVTVGRRLMFVTDTMTPVLTPTAANPLDLQMIKVGDTAQETRSAPATIGAHGLKLPATFTGEMPCPDCKALEIKLNLWSDQVFHMQRTWEESGRREDTIGRWSIDPATRVLTLRSAGQLWQFRILGSDRLQPLPAAGEVAVEADKDKILVATDEVEPFDPHLPLRGMLTYVGDDARFTECMTGRDYPLIEDGDYDALEHAYLAAGAEAGGPIMASFDGGIIGELNGDSTEEGPGVMVDRFVGIWPGETCERAMDEASLTSTYWKILRIGDTDLSAIADRREPNLILREGDPRFTATVGCNQVAGTFVLKDENLTFGQPAMTRMACPAPLDDWESKLTQVLLGTTGWRIDGQTMELLDTGGNTLALFQAVYLY